MEQQHSRIPGQQRLMRRFTKTAERLHTAGRSKVADALRTAQEAVMTAQGLSSQQRQAQLEVLSQIGEEAAQEKPDKTVMGRLLELLAADPVVTAYAAEATVEAIKGLVDLLGHVDWDSIDLSSLDLGG